MDGSSLKWTFSYSLDHLGGFGTQIWINTQKVYVHLLRPAQNQLTFSSKTRETRAATNRDEEMTQSLGKLVSVACGKQVRVVITLPRHSWALPVSRQCHGHSGPAVRCAVTRLGSIPAWAGKRMSHRETNVWCNFFVNIEENNIRAVGNNF